MEDVPRVHVVQSQADLDKVSHDLVFRKVSSALLALVDTALEVTAVGVAHDDAQLAILNKRLDKPGADGTTVGICNIHNQCTPAATLSSPKLTRQCCCGVES